MSSSTTDSDVAVDIVMPQMGSSVAEGTVLEWKVAVGDVVAEDQILCEISTDKVDSEYPSPASGTVSELLVEAGATVDVGTPIARIMSSDAAGGHAPAPAPAPAATATPQAATNGAHAEPGADSDGGQLPDRRAALRRSSPVALRIALEHHLDVLRLEGSGHNGRVTKRDVLRAIERGAGSDAPMHIESPYRADASIPVAGRPAPAAAPAAAPEAPAGVPDDLGGTVTELSRMRRSIGTAMRQALDTAAHCTTIVECDMSRIERERRAQGLTALPILATHVIATLHAFPALNATLQGDTYTRYERVHLGIAVSLGEEGLIVPVIHDAQDLSAEGLGKRIKDLARRARAKQLAPDEVGGGTFTITNPGAFGAMIATPVLNIPQVGILDLEAIVKRPVVVTDDDGNDSIAIRPMTNLCMSWDHRVLDGVYAAQFLTALRKRIEGAAG